MEPDGPSSLPSLDDRPQQKSVHGCSYNTLEERLAARRNGNKARAQRYRDKQKAAVVLDVTVEEDGTLVGSQSRAMYQGKKLWDFF